MKIIATLRHLKVRASTVQKGIPHVGRLQKDLRIRVYLGQVNSDLALYKFKRMILKFITKFHCYLNDLVYV